MGVRWRDDVDDVDVGAADHRLPIVGGLGDAELLGVGGSPLAFHVTDADHLTALVTLPARNMGVARPRACPKNTNPQPAAHAPLSSSAARSSRPAPPTSRRP